MLIESFTCALSWCSIRVLILARNVDLGGNHLLAELIFATEIKLTPNFKANNIVSISTLLTACVDRFGKDKVVILRDSLFGISEFGCCPCSGIFTVFFLLGWISLNIYNIHWNTWSSDWFWESFQNTICSTWFLESIHPDWIHYRLNSLLYWQSSQPHRLAYSWPLWIRT